MQPLRSVNLLLAIVFSNSVFAATAFEETVPVGRVRQFTNGQLYSDLPDSFPAIDLPDSLSELGSLENQLYSVVVFNNALTVEESVMALTANLNTAGWTELPPLGYEPPENGFVYPDIQPQIVQMPMEFCQNRYGMLTINPQDITRLGNNISIRLSNRILIQPGFSCQQQLDQREMQNNRGGPGQNMGMINSDYMPRLEMPANSNARSPATPRLFGLGGFSSSNNNVETRSRLTGMWMPAELNAHFAQQLQAQGWMLESEWAGEITAGNNWTLSPRQELQFLGTLSIHETAADVFELRFNLVTREGSSAGAGIRD